MHICYDIRNINNLNKGNNFNKIFIKALNISMCSLIQQVKAPSVFHYKIVALPTVFLRM